MMRRAAIVVLAMLLAVSFSGMAFAQGTSTGGQPGPTEIFQQKLGAAKTHTVEGTVLSHDVSCHCIVLKSGKGNITLQDDYAKFEGDYDRAKGLNVGGKYRIVYKTVDFINYAVEIHPEK